MPTACPIWRVMAISLKPNRCQRIHSIKWASILRTKRRYRKKGNRRRRKQQVTGIVKLPASNLQPYCRKGRTMNNNQQQRSFFFNVDWLMVLIYLALCTIGILNIHSAVFRQQSPSFFDLSTDYGKQLMFVVVGLCVGVMILLLDSRFFSSLAPFFYGITVVLLMLVLVIGRNVGGYQGWISLGGGFRLQPSEFAKLSTCLLLARYLSGTNIKVTDTRSFLIAAVIIGCPMLLIMLQPDAGST